MTGDQPPRDLDAAKEIAADFNAGYLAIGRFIYEFSGLELMMRIVLGKRLNLRRGYFDIVVSPYDFATLCRVTSSVLALQFPAQKDDIEQFCKACLRLNDERVKVAHGSWMMGDEGPMARHVQRGTLKAKLHFKDKEELTRLADEAQRLAAVVFTWDNSSNPPTNGL